MKIKMVVTDMDGSAIKGKIPPFFSGWDAVGECLPESIRTEWYRIRDYYYPKRELYDEWFQKQLDLLQGISVNMVRQQILPLSYSPGFIDFFTNIPQGIIKGLISSGIDLIAKEIQKEVGLDFIACQQVDIKDGKFTGTGKNVTSLWSKLDVLARKAEEYGVLLSEICFIGDNENDEDALKAVGFPYLINPAESMKRKFPEIQSYLDIKW